MSAIDDLQAIDDDNDKSLQLTKEMELNDILKENEPRGRDELVSSCIVNKEHNPEDYAFGNLPTNNDDFSYYGFCASPQQIFSPLQAGFSDNVVFDDAQFIVDDERVISSPKEYYQQHEGEDLCSDYLCKSSFQVELNETDVAVTREQEMVHERVISLSNNESTKSEDEALDVLKMTDSLIYVHEPPCFSKINTPNHSTLVPQTDKEDTDTEEKNEFSTKNHVTEEQEIKDSPRTTDSPVGSAHTVRSNDKKNRIREPSASRVSESPRNQHSVRNHRIRKRSVSKSPSRRKETSSRHRRDHRERSRSRSPRRRQCYRRSRSPRRRYSPSYRSPPSSYRSRYRSPKRRNWSPPHNRSTGLGKPGKNLFIAGFCFLTTEQDLDRKFSRFGRVRDVRIVRNKRSGESRGFGFLTLERDEEADEAIRVLDKTEWNGRIILVEKSKPNS